MKVNKLRHLRNNKGILNFLIVFSFVLWAVLNVAFLFHRQMIVGADTGFHWQEIFELMRSKAWFPQYALNSFSNNGSAVLTMFPYLLLWPFVLAFHLFHSVSLSSYAVFSMNTFITLMISYYASLKISRNKLVSYWFALMYALSYVFIIRSFWSYDVGMTYSAVFMPLAIFGFIALLRFNHWIMLTIGMSLIIYSNVIVAVFVPVILLLWLLYDYSWLSVSKLINLGKAILLTLLVTGAFWLPALHTFRLNSMHTPNTNHLNGVSFQMLIQKFLDPTAILRVGKFPFSLTMAAVLGLVIGAIFIIHASALIKQFYGISLLIILLCSDLFPWSFFNNHITMVRTLQFPWRLYLIPQLLLVYVLADCLVKVTGYLSGNYRLAAIGLIFVGIFGLQISMQRIFLQQFRRYPATVRVYPATVSTLNRNLVTNHSNRDYYPNVALRFGRYIQNDQGVYLVHRKINSVPFSSYGHGRFGFRLSHPIKDLSIPFLDYNGEYYHVYANGQRLYSSSNNQLITIHNVKEGIYHLTVIPLIGITVIMGRIFSITGLIILLWLGIKKHF